MTKRHNVMTISAGSSFVDALAGGLIDGAGGDPFHLSDTLVLLPNRRACRALRDAFLRVTNGRPTLLPTMRPLGDTDENHLSMTRNLPGETAEFPPEISPLRRLLLMAQLIRKHSPDGEQLSFDHAVRLSKDLTRLIDQTQTEGLSFDRLDKLVPERYATHWQRTLELLHVVTSYWPKTLAAAGCIDPADRRNRLIDALTELWQREPPQRPVIAAGSTGTIPAVSRLLKCIAAFPSGLVILPGLDRSLDANSTVAAASDETHPQYGMLRLLTNLGITTQEVAEYRPNSASHQYTDRRQLLSEIMRPAATTDAWRDLEPFPKKTFNGVKRIVCPNEAEEARVIALALRQSLEDASKSAALVTPDRGLARRVAAALRRWKIEVDDSAGLPLAYTPPGMFLNLVAAMVSKRFAPVAPLAAMKHPLAACGHDRDVFRDNIRLLERRVLRGPKPEPGLEGLRQAVPEDLDTNAAGRIVALLEALECAVGPFRDLMALPERPLPELIAAHVAAAEAVASQGSVSGAERLWLGEAGEALAEFIEEAVQASFVADPISTMIYPTLLITMMTDRVVRPHYGRHPRLHIWGPLEARLQNADFIILGGLNEGNWPRDPDPDPWLSRPMQENFGLPLPERRIGLAAHDFVMAAAAPEVLLTRSEKSAGTPTVPSRWLARLDAVMLAAAPQAAHGTAHHWQDWARALDAPGKLTPSLPPTPRPPVYARPKKLSVTRIEAWMRDPYSIFARDILKLRPLDPLEADPTAADRGTIIHATLDRFISETTGALPTDAETRLYEIGRSVFSNLAKHPVVHAFWWPRFERVARWFIDIERRRRTDITISATEVRGQLALAVGNLEFTLTAIADRVDRLTGGGYAILDYKTGKAPTNADIADGFAPQLPLEAVIAMAGGFSNLPPEQVESLSFWRLSGGQPAGEIQNIKGDIGELAEIARNGLVKLIAAYNDAETPYAAVPNPAKAPRFNDYMHLARLPEWLGLPSNDAS